MGPAAYRCGHHWDYELRSQRNGYGAHAWYGQRTDGAISFHIGLGKSLRVLLALGFFSFHGLYAAHSAGN